MPFDTGNTAFILICAAMVFIMTPGLGLFYGGLGRRKNMVNNLMHSFFLIGLASVMWILIGYSLSFSGNWHGIVGDLKNVALRGIDTGTIGAGNAPEFAFIVFQLMFSIITPAIITGSVAGRIKFKSLFIFMAVWLILVYYPLAHMVWGSDGFMATTIGAVDFAGGNVVHISSGVSGLVLAIYLGRRIGYGELTYKIHNVPFVALGTALLLFGWFGFNSGSALAADGLAAHAFITTIGASAAALLGWVLLDIIVNKKPTMIGACTGIVVGLVAITPGAGFVPVWASLIIGLLAAPISYFGIVLVKNIFKIDDSLDAFGCHGIGGMWGGIATGLFASPAVNEAVGKGLVFGASKQFIAQILSILLTIVIAVVGSLIAIGIARIIGGPLRVSKKHEMIGMDHSQHGESAYPAFTGLD